jgi:serine/threonine-protein kinase
VIGQRFGNYRAVSLLGEGGMGAVYLAEHPQIGRRVAVKVLRPEMIREQQLLVRFLNEARAANAIRHPNIIEVLDSGTTPEGVPYLVMELLEGEVLSARIRRAGKLPLREAMEFAYQTASALAAAHGKGIVHRDLKPDNLFVVPHPGDPGAREMIKVLDFGIAKLQTLPTGGGMQTRTGMLMGTPVYMSPEQCLGTRAVDHRSDLYSLGIIMFEMLAGRPPFVSEGFGELVNMHLNVRPPSLRDLNADVTAPIEGLIMKALEKSPEARQRSATELQMDIRNAAGQSVMMRGISSPDLLSETMPGNTAGARAAAVTIPAPAKQGSGPVVGSTTMSGSTGERHAPTVKTRGNRGLLAGAGVLAVLLGVGAWIAAKKVGPAGAGGANAQRAEEAGDPRTGGGTAQPDKKVAAAVQLNIDSDPSGASVTEEGTGKKLGQTPLMLVRPAADQNLNLLLDKPGFVSSTLVLNLAHDARELVKLPAVAAPPPPADLRPVGSDGHVRPEPRPHAAEHSKKDHPHHPAVQQEEEPAKL